MRKDQHSLQAYWFLNQLSRLSPSVTLFQAVSSKTGYPWKEYFVLEVYSVEDVIPTPGVDSGLILGCCKILRKNLSQ